MYTELIQFKLNCKKDDSDKDDELKKKQEKLEVCLSLLCITAVCMATYFGS